MPDYPYGDRNT